MILVDSIWWSNFAGFRCFVRKLADTRTLSVELPPGLWCSNYQNFRKEYEHGNSFGVRPGGVTLVPFALDYYVMSSGVPK